MSSKAVVLSWSRTATNSANIKSNPNNPLPGGPYKRSRYGIGRSIRVVTRRKALDSVSSSKMADVRSNSKAS